MSKAPRAHPASSESPPPFLRGQDVWLWDADGGQYLDATPLAPLLGHCHPRILEAAHRQSAMLATATGDPHPLVRDLVERLAATLPPGLTRASLVTSAAEANDMALRLVQAATGRRGIIAVDGARHGDTTALAAIAGRGEAVRGIVAHVRRVPPPDPPGLRNADAADQARAFARNVALAIADLEDLGIGFAGMILCPAFTSLGLPAVPPGFLGPTEALIRRAGGLLIADEVQSGFGRLGSHFWGLTRIGITPDVVTMGSAMANGYPAAAAFTRPEIMAAFDESAADLAAPGGNPVAAAAAGATLDVLAQDDLMQNAATTGVYLLDRLRALRHPLLAEVRGAGLFIVIRIGPAQTDSRDTAIRLARALRRDGVLTGIAGPGRDLIELRPPLTFSRAHADRLTEALANALAVIAERS